MSRLTGLSPYWTVCPPHSTSCVSVRTTQSNMKPQKKASSPAEWSSKQAFTVALWSGGNPDSCKHPQSPLPDKNTKWVVVQECWHRGPFLVVMTTSVTTVPKKKKRRPTVEKGWWFEAGACHVKLRLVCSSACQTRAHLLNKVGGFADACF